MGRDSDRRASRQPMACHYELDRPDWASLRPYTSRDLDYHGGLADARLAMRVLGAQGKLNTTFDPSPNASILKLELAHGRELIIDILTGVMVLVPRRLNVRRSYGRELESFRI